MSLCKQYDCLKCEAFNTCGGCEKNNGCPNGTICVAARIIKTIGFSEYINIQENIINEVNNLKIDKLHIDKLNVMPGAYVNLEYLLPSGNIKLLDEKLSYFTYQVEKDNERCYGIVSDGDMLIIAEYGCNGINPELILYKKLKK